MNSTEKDKIRAMKGWQLSDYAWNEPQKKMIKTFIKKFMDWCWKNNTIPLKDLHNIECVCGHSLIEHESFSFDKEEGKKCFHKFCDCPSYKEIIFKSPLKLASLDGGWVNVLKLQDEIKRLLGGI